MCGCVSVKNCDHIFLCLLLKLPISLIVFSFCFHIPLFLNNKSIRSICVFLLKLVFYVVWILVVLFAICYINLAFVLINYFNIFLFVQMIEYFFNNFFCCCFVIYLCFNFCFLIDASPHPSEFPLANH